MQRNIPRSRSSSRRTNLLNSNETNQLSLEKVFGFTIQNNAAVALDPTSGIVAFPAGCVVVGYSAKRSKQFFIHNAVKSPITALAFSKDGKLLVTGESGKSPKVRIWNVETRTQIVEFNGHNFRVGALTISPNSRFVVSVGSQEDMAINVWELSSNMKIASSKVTSRVNAMAFSETGQFFVTVGVRHVRFWYLDSSRSKVKTTIPLNGRNAILGDFMNNTFTDVGCCCLNSATGAGQMTSSMCSSITSSTSQNYTYVISQAGQLMQFTEQRYLDKWVELRTPKATCLTVCESCIMVGCSRGIILLFDTSSLSHISTLPMPHYLGINLQVPSEADIVTNSDPVRYPDIIAGKYDHLHSRITCFYNDHSIYVWDIRDVRKPSKVQSHLYHSGGIWAVEPVPYKQGDGKNILDVSTFITCSDDETIRFWHLSDAFIGNNQAKLEKLPTFWKNDFSKDLIKIIYSDPHLKSLTESDRVTARNKAQANDGNNAVQPKCGIRSIKISPDRQHLAAADREGNLKFYSLANCKELHSVIAHNGEILSIEYFQSPSAPDLILFCSASRDRVIHVMDPSQSYRCIQTIDDHSGAIFAARLVETPTDQEIRLISCGMDKSLLFRILQPDESGQTAQFFLNQHLVSKQSQYDMVIAPNNRYAAVVCQDRQVRIYNLVTGKLRKSYRGATSEDGTLLKCATDPSGTYIATSGSDRQIHILNFVTGELIASVAGHSEVALGISFLSDLKHLITVSSDSCIFVWRLPVEMTLTMVRRLKEMKTLNNANIDYDLSKETAPPSTSGTVTPPRLSEDLTSESSNIFFSSPQHIPSIPLNTENNVSSAPPAFRFSVSALPSWAQKKVNMMSEFCNGINNHVNTNISENSSMLTMKTKAETRRLSFIATEKVIREDDSDNIEAEDDPEWFKVENKEDILVDIDTIMHHTNVEDDEEEEEDITRGVSKFPIRSNSLEDENCHKQNCGFVIQSNSDMNNYEENLMSTSAPSAFAAWPKDVNRADDDSDDVAIEDDSELLRKPNRVSSDDNILTDEFGLSDSFCRRSLTTQYLTKHPIGPTILQFEKSPTQILMDSKAVSKPNINTVEKHVIHVHDEHHVKGPKKALSELNVNTLTKSRTSSTTFKPNVTQPNIKAEGSICPPSKSRPDSKDRKESISTPRKFSQSSGRVGLSKAVSISSISKTPETKPRSFTDASQARRSLDSKTVSKSNANTDLKTPRARWSVPKRSREHRTCPIEPADIKRASLKTLLNSETVSSDVVRKQETVVSAVRQSEVVKVEPLPIDKGTASEVSVTKAKEHVIDEIEEVTATSPTTSEINNTVIDDMFKFLTNRNDNSTSNSSTITPRPAFSGTGAEAEAELVKELNTTTEKELFSDEWIDDICQTHSSEFLINLVSKIIQRIADNTELEHDTQNRSYAIFLYEIDRIRQKIRSRCDLSSDSAESELTATIIRDIGEKIIDEVKRRLSDSI